MSKTSHPLGHHPENPLAGSAPVPSADGDAAQLGFQAPQPSPEDIFLGGRIWYQWTEVLGAGAPARLGLTGWSAHRFVILSVVLFGLVYNPHEACSLNLVDHGRGYLGILLSCMIAEMAIIWLSMRGGILYTEPRDSMQYVLYVRLGKGHPPRVGGCSRPQPARSSCTHRLPPPPPGTDLCHETGTCLQWV